MLLYEWTFVRGSLRECWRRSWPLYLGLTASWLPIVALQWNTPRSQSAGFGLAIPVVDWWCTQAQVFWMYLKLAIYPSPLVIHYELPLRSFGENWGYVAATVALAVLTLALLWRRKAAGFLLACVFLILAPTHLVPIPTEMAAERRMYLPLAALVAMVVVGEFALAARFLSPSAANVGRPTGGRAKLLAVAVVLVLAAAYGVASAQRLAMYQAPVKLWQDAVDNQPDNPTAQQGLASALAADRRLEEAIGHYRAALRSKSDNAQLHYGLGLALAHLGQLDEAVEHLQTVVRLKPDAYKLRNNLGVVLFTAGRLPEAIAEFEKTLELRPDFAEARDNLNRARRASVLPKKSQ